MMSDPPRKPLRLTAVTRRHAVWAILGAGLFGACASLLSLRGAPTGRLTEIRSISYPGLATGLAVHESGQLMAAVSNRRFDVVDLASGATLYRYDSSGEETCGQGLCWVAGERAVLFSTGSTVHCVDVPNRTLFRDIATTRHFRSTQLLFHEGHLLIAGEVPGDFGVFGEVEVWEWNGVGKALTRKQVLSTINDNVHDISLQCDAECCIAATASGSNAGATLVRFSDPQEWRFSLVRHIPIPAGLVSRLDRQRFVFKGTAFVEVYRVDDCGDRVVREWVVALKDRGSVRYPIAVAAYRSLDVLNDGVVVLGTECELLLLDRAGARIGARRQQTGAVCRIGHERMFAAAHPGKIVQYQVK